MEPEPGTCARLLFRVTSAEAVARAGQRIFMKFNIKYISKKYTKEDIINETVPHNDIEEAQGYKPSSTETQGPKPQAKGGPARLIPKSTSSRIRDPG